MGYVLGLYREVSNLMVTNIFLHIIVMKWVTNNVGLMCLSTLCYTVCNKIKRPHSCMLINTPKTPNNRELLTPYLLLPIGFISLLTVSTLVY